MSGSGFLCIHEKNSSLSELNTIMKQAAPFFDKTCIVTKYPEILGDFNFNIVVPFYPDSFFYTIYTGIFFLESEKIIAAQSNFNFSDLNIFNILNKNLHNGVDAAIFYKDNNPEPLPGAYSYKIINKFKNTDPEKADDVFFKRLKINKIKKGCYEK
ncbi:MAG: hypothetical protein ACQEQS_03620 [Thermodesulfobacteriota bacterium]